MSVNLPKEKQINLHYVELHRYIQNGDYEKLIRTCNKILNLGPDEVKAFHCKIICFIQSGKFEECLQRMLKFPELSKTMYFEKAYCEYRLNDPEKALQTVESAPALTEELRELKAQLMYRLERYKECYSLYRDIVKHATDDYDVERQTNISAVMSFIPLREGMVEPPPDTYEIMYNNAYKLITRSEWIQAEKLLLTCQTLCRESLEEDGCTEEEIVQEMDFIRLQLAYCYQKQGRIKEAQNIYTAMLKANSDDVGLNAIASNNLVAINKDQNLFDSKKKMKTAMQDSIKHKLNQEQSKIISINHCLLLYYLNQTDNCLRFCDRLEELWPDDKTAATVIRAVIRSRDGKVDEAVKSLTGLSEKQPDNSLYLQLAAVQLLMNAGEHNKACDALHNLGEHTYRLGVVGSLVSLHLALGDKVGAAKVFEDTVAWYRKHQLGLGDAPFMWLQAAEFHMKYGNSSVAATCLEEVLRTDPNNKRTVAKLIMAYVQCDAKKAEVLSRKLPSLDELTKNISADDIESTTWSYGSRQVRNKNELSPGTPRSDSDTKKRLKKRKSKNNLPPGVYLDPERWLPKYERSGFKKKRDRRAKDVIKGSQGSAVSNSEVFDFSNKSGGDLLIEESAENEAKAALLGKKAQGQKKKKKGSRK